MQQYIHIYNTKSVYLNNNAISQGTFQNKHNQRIDKTKTKHLNNDKQHIIVSIIIKTNTTQYRTTQTTHVKHKYLIKIYTYNT